nr:hypothetical protein [Candidatus Sigynarchaeota archaeon]
MNSTASTASLCNINEFLGVSASDSTPSEVAPENVAFSNARFTPSPNPSEDAGYTFWVGHTALAWFSPSKVSYNVNGTIFVIRFHNSSTTAPIGMNPTGTMTNYLSGYNPSEWRTGLADCTSIVYHGLYTGIDLVYSFADGKLKYKFQIEAGSDPTCINMAFEAITSLEFIKTKGDGVTSFEARIGNATFTDSGLCAWQLIGGVQVPVPCQFARTMNQGVTFVVQRVDDNVALIIDPVVLEYSTFLGGPNNEDGFDMFVDGGYAYITGQAYPGYPSTGSAYDPSHNGGTDVFVTKLSTSGAGLVYSTFIGGGNYDGGFDVFVEDGYAYITGYAQAGFPTTAGAYDTSQNGDADAFVVKLSKTGDALIYSTFLGGSGSDRGCNIKVEDGYAYITGFASPGFPTTAGANDTSHNGGLDTYIAKLSPNGSVLVYSTFLGGSGDDIPDEISVVGGNAYIIGYTTDDATDFPTTPDAYDRTNNGGTDVFVTELSTSGGALVYSTMIGTPGNDGGSGIEIEGGYAYISGFAASGFPTTVDAYDSSFNGVYDAFLTVMALNSSGLIYSTYIGGSGSDGANNIYIDNGRIYLTGTAPVAVTNFPTTVDAFEPAPTGLQDAFLTIFMLDPILFAYSTFIGGTGTDAGFAVAAENGNAYLMVNTANSTRNFPATGSAFDNTHNGGNDVVVCKFDMDADNDGLEDFYERILGTNPEKIDTDGDNFLDGYEVLMGTNATDPADFPILWQSDFDYLNAQLNGNTTLLNIIVGFVAGNWTYLQSMQNAIWSNFSAIEAALAGLDGVLGDLDGDGLADLYEIGNGTNPCLVDTDNDNLNDAFELRINTNPVLDDTDGDGYMDGREYMAGTDPLDANSFPGTPPGDVTTFIVGCIAVAGIIVGFTAIWKIKKNSVGGKARTAMV